MSLIYLSEFILDKNGDYYMVGLFEYQTAIDVIDPQKDGFVVLEKETASTSAPPEIKPMLPPPLSIPTNKSKHSDKLYPKYTNKFKTVDADPRQPFPDEPRYEFLIRRIQQRDGLVISREEREDDFVELIKQFEGFIKKIAKSTWKKSNKISLEDWHSDTISTFYEYIISDYIHPRYGGASPFAPYIKTKLYFRMVHKGQEENKYINRSFASEMHTVLDSEWTENNDLRKTVLRSMLENSISVEEEFIANKTDMAISEKLKEIKVIAKEILNERDHSIWEKYFYTGLKSRDIGASLDMPGLNSVNVNVSIKNSRTSILSELGKRHMKKFFIDA